MIRSSCQAGSVEPAAVVRKAGGVKVAVPAPSLKGWVGWGGRKVGEAPSRFTQERPAAWEGVAVPLLTRVTGSVQFGESVSAQVGKPHQVWFWAAALGIVRLSP